MLTRVIWAGLLSGLLAMPGGVAAQAVQSAPVVETTPSAHFYEAGEKAIARAAAGTVATGPDVISAADPRASAAGLEILQAGGTAADAIAATMIALTVAEPQSSGLGGGGFLIFRDARTGSVTTLDGRETAPRSADSRLFVADDGKPMSFAQAVPGGRSVGVPGMLALAAETHKRWGKLPWARLFGPAIRLAEEGILVTSRMHQFTTSRQAMLSQNPDAARLFLLPDGTPLPVGHRLKQPELAKTLRILAKKGPDEFYHGKIGASITRAVAQSPHNPAVLSAQDLADYEVKDRPPLCRPYRQLQVCTMGPPSAGGLAILQILQQLERFDMAKLGADNLLSQHLFAESQRLAYADREAYGADSDFAEVPVEALLSPAYIASRSALIRIDRAMPAVSSGIPGRIGAPLGDIPATSHLAAADRAGNIVSVTSTIEGPFGSGLMASGFMLNNELTDFDFLPVKNGQPAPNAVQPGKRPRSSMAPVIVLDATGTPLAAFGAAGGATIIAQVAKALIAYIDWGMGPAQAIAAPQIIADNRGLRYEIDTRLESMAAGLKALGHIDVRATTMPLKGNGLARDPAGWQGGADPRTEGKALATEGQ